MDREHVIEDDYMNDELDSGADEDSCDGRPIVIRCKNENETRDSWSWFVNLLLDDIGWDSRWCFISDQQKGLQKGIPKTEGSSKKTKTHASAPVQHAQPEVTLSQHEVASAT
ncbi:hypothetical protein KIW84_053282 [Lathyrus oleraceus]|uniref:Uncharacterized protein n=1 Tax=Pisum sativum TaxID=3888 RepID=A0A9D4WSK4_PEA|nr:hypothetical protein KIW84_053282 [Pisum sativum]